ncbi:MAG: Rne/Rng family ribonuclease [Syntrophales bacterium]
MKKEMLIDAVHQEQKRMAVVDDGKLVEFNIQMAIREPITGNIYKGIVLKVGRGLQAAFVNYGGQKDGFLPLHDVSVEYLTGQNGEKGNHGRPSLKAGQEVLVQALRDVGRYKGALLTTYISLPGRYLVLLPNRAGAGISRKIEDEGERERLKKMANQIKGDESIGFIVRTAGMNRTKQELSRDYQHLLRLWKEIQKREKALSAPVLIYQESDFGIRSLRDYFTSEIEEILVDDFEMFRKMRIYCKTVAPRNVRMIKLYKEKTHIFDRYQLEDQIRAIYQERVNLISGGYIIINPTEAMITIDVNSGKASSKRNIEETAFRTNMEAAEEIARQLRLRDLGGLIVIDFIDMKDRKHEAELEKTFKKALSLDRARIQLSHISRFGILELSRQKKQSTIQEVSYVTCPFCKGRGVRPSLEYKALSAFRKIESQAVKGFASSLKVTLPHEIADYLLNQKRREISKLESLYDMFLCISGSPNLAWDDLDIQVTSRKVAQETPDKLEEGTIEPAADTQPQVVAEADEQTQKTGELVEISSEPVQKRSRRRPRYRRKKPKIYPEEGTEKIVQKVEEQENLREVKEVKFPE